MMKHLVSILGMLMMTFSVAAANITTTAYTDNGHGKAIVLIHAFPTDKRLWNAQQEALSIHFRVITLDLPGFGDASAVDGKAITMTDYADYVKTLLDQLHIQKAIIGGESMGGYISLAFVKKYPERVEGLILSDTQSIADNEETKAKREATAIEALTNGTDKVIAGFMPKALSPEAPESVKNALLSIVRDQPATAIASALRGMALREDTSDILLSSSLPILILTGDQDALISPQQSENMHALAKNSRLIKIPHAGHLASLEQSDAWNKAVIEMFYRTKR